MIKTYAKRPPTIQAIQYTGDNIDEINEFLEINSKCEYISKVINGRKVNYAVFKNIYGCCIDGNVDIGDYVIKNNSGIIYSCKPDVFEKTYYEIETSNK